MRAISRWTRKQRLSDKVLCDAVSEMRQGVYEADVSQAVFAAVLNTSVSTVQKWEIGRKRPTGTALKLLHRVQKMGFEAVMC